MSLRKSIKEADEPYSFTKKDVGETVKAAKKLKGIYDFSYFTRKNIGKRKGIK